MSAQGCDHCARSAARMTKVAVSRRDDRTVSKVIRLCPNCVASDAATWRRQWVEIPTKGKFQTRSATASEGVTRQRSTGDGRMPGREHFNGKAGDQ